MNKIIANQLNGGINGNSIYNTTNNVGYVNQTNDGSTSIIVDKKDISDDYPPPLPE